MRLLLSIMKREGSKRSAGVIWLLPGVRLGWFRERSLSIVSRLSVAVWSGLVGGLLLAQQPPAPKPCPAEGFSGGFSHGCPQKQFANPSDISVMMAALPEKPLATPQGLRHVLVLCTASAWV